MSKSGNWGIDYWPLYSGVGMLVIAGLAFRDGGLGWLLPAAIAAMWIGVWIYERLTNW